MRHTCLTYSSLAATPDTTRKSYDVEVTSGDDDEYREVLEWQAAVQDFLALEVELAEGNSGLNLVYSTGRSLNDALEETIAGEVFLFVITCKSAARFVSRFRWCLVFAGAEVAIVNTFCCLMLLPMLRLVCFVVVVRLSFAC